MQLQGHLQDEFRWAYDSSRDGLSDGQANYTLAHLLATLVTARPAAIHYVASLSELRLAIAACFLETNYVQARLSILTPFFRLSPHPMLPVKRHRLHVCVVTMISFCGLVRGHISLFDVLPSVLVSIYLPSFSLEAFYGQ